MCVARSQQQQSSQMGTAVASPDAATAVIEASQGADAWEEIFDVVDDQDSVIGQERRDIVHREGLLHRSVHIFVTDGKRLCIAPLCLLLVHALTHLLSPKMPTFPLSPLAVSLMSQ